MESLPDNDVQGEAPSESSEAATRKAPSRKTIAGVAYVRDSIGCYVPESYLKAKTRIRKPQDALPALAFIRYSPQEIFAVLDLDGSNQIIEVRHVTLGLANQSQIHPRETFRGAIANSAVSIALAHNHPSGSLEPSESDLTATRRMVEVGKTLGIPVIDHIIVAGDGFISLRERFPAYFV